MLNKKAIVLFSSGHDSFYCLTVALEKYQKADIICLIYDYGQTNPLEIERATGACKKIGVDFKIISLPPMDKNLNKRTGVSTQYYPARNLVMLSVGCSVAEQCSANDLYIGVCLEDNVLFPDCRKDFVEKFSSLYHSAYSNVNILAPCLEVTKSTSYKRILHSTLYPIYQEFTYSCYNNSEQPFFDRVGCGECGACLSISKGIFNE